MSVPFELQLFQRVTCENGEEGIIAPNMHYSDSEFAIVFKDGWTDATFNEKSYGYNIAKVYDRPQFTSEMLNIQSKGELLWQKESEEVKQAIVAVEAAKKSLAEAEATLQAIKDKESN